MTEANNIDGVLWAVIQSDERLAKLFNGIAPALPALKKTALLGIDRAVSVLRGLGQKDPTESLTALRNNSTQSEYDLILTTIAANACAAVIRQIEAEEEGTELFWRIIVGLLIAAIGAV